MAKKPAVPPATANVAKIIPIPSIFAVPVGLFSLLGVSWGLSVVSGATGLDGSVVGWVLTVGSVLDTGGSVGLVVG